MKDIPMKNLVPVCYLLPFLNLFSNRRYIDIQIKSNKTSTGMYSAALGDVVAQ
jgi:hypothetical protein